MKITREHLKISLAFIAALAVLTATAVMILRSTVQSSPSESTAPTPVTATLTQPSATATVTHSPWSTQTFETMKPPDPAGCIQNDMSTAGWNTATDDTSEDSDSRPGVMALGNVDGTYFQSGDCFDTMVVKTDTSEAVGFEVQYVDKSELVGIASGLPVAVQGSYFLRFTVAAHVSEETDHPFTGPVFSPHGDSFPAIQDVKFLGYQEGRMAFAVGVSDKLPFAATREANPDGAPDTVAVTLHVAHQRS